MSLAATRQVLRHSRFAVRRAGVRNASSTTSEAAGAAKEKAAETASQASTKASEAASKASSQASQAASQAQSKASEAASKASEGLSRVVSSASAAASKVGSAAANAANSAAAAGGRTGTLVGRIQSLIPQVVYYSRVGLELGKLVAHQRGMAPPSTATFQAYLQPVTKALRNPATLFAQAGRVAESSSAQPQNVLQRVRGLSQTQWLSAGIIAAEVIGFFSVGEMIGRFKLVGYRAAPAHH